MPAKEPVEKALRQEVFAAAGMEQEAWAKAVAHDLLRKSGPPPVIWRGESAWLVRLSTVLPFGWFDGMVKRIQGLDVAERILRG